MIDLKSVLANIERGYIVCANVEHNNNHARAAKSLGMLRTTFVEKMRKYGLPLGPKCVKKIRGDKLNADHIKSYNQYPELREVLSNGRTLCVPCHKKTDTYGSKSKIKKDNKNVSISIKKTGSVLSHGYSEEKGNIRIDSEGV